MDRRVESLHPAFRPIVEEVLRRAPERRIYPFVTQGRRAPEYQACLYAQGRVAIGKSATFAALSVSAALSRDGRSVIATCGKSSNVVPLKRWSSKVTQVGPYGSWHVLGLAVDFSFRSGPDRRDDVIHDLEDAIAIARKGGDAKRASEFYGVIARQYEALATIWDAVVPAAIWGNDWDDDGIMNGPDPDNEWSDLPHWEWHPGIRSIGSLSSDDVKRVLAGTLPAVPKQCSRCRGFSPVAIDGACRECYEGGAVATLAGAGQRVVTATVLNVRRGPSVSAGVLQKLRAGEVVSVTGTVEREAGTDWSAIQLSSGIKGWVASRYLGRVGAQ